MPSKSTGQDRLENEQKRTVEESQSMVQWSKKPRLVQYNAGRIEFSMPYQVGIALLLALILVILASYRLGQFSYQPPVQEPAQPSGLMRQVEQDSQTEQAAIDLPPSPPVPTESTTLKTENVDTDIKPNTEPAETTGNNVIVLVQYHTPADLGPVQAHFEEHGIATEIEFRNNRYFLQTVDRYDNPDKVGTDGYEAKQKIIEIGKKYKAPLGYETFAAHYFADAYGMKIE
jgi:hypothetical protein